MHAGSLGGAERQGLGISKYLTECHNCNVYLLLTYSLETTQEFDEYLAQSCIKEVFHFGEPYLVGRREVSVKNLKRFVWSSKYLLRMRKGLKSYDIDIILPFLNFPSKIAYYLYKLLPTAKFTFWHQLGMDIQKADVFETIAANNIPCVIANAPNGLDYFREDYKLEEKRAFVLPQYLSMEYVTHDKNALRATFNVDKDAVVIGMISHYRPEKFQVQLLEVFSKLIIQYPQIHLMLLGNKNSTTVTAVKYELLEKQINEYGLNDTVSLLSEVPAEKVLSMIDIGVLLSSIEGMPNVVMEYMLYDLPVVATNHPGCVELLKESSFLIENEDDQIYKALEELVVTAAIRKAEGDNNKAIIKNYTKKDYIEKLTSIMNQFVKN